MALWTPAYNTNGFAHHRLEDALRILSELGYGAVALTLDVHHLDPFAPSLPTDCAHLRQLLNDLNLEVIIESGARFNLDPRRKHYPSLLVEQGGEVRQDFLKRCHDVALSLGASCVSFWSGHNFDELPEAKAYELMAERIAGLVQATRGSGVAWAFEPEPGMFIDTLDRFDHLNSLLGNERIGLALDLGHLLVTQERTPEVAIREYANQLVTVAIEDMKQGVHDHLPFGEGDVSFPPIFEALAEIQYDGILSVELSRQSSIAPVTAKDSIEFLNRFASPADA